MLYDQLFGRSVDYDTWSDDEKFEIEVDVPGVEKDDVEVLLDNNKLNISWERKSLNRTFGKRNLAFYIPDQVSVSKITTKLDKGVLNVTLPKNDKKKRKRIPVITG
jgi:HSP20 family protein